MAEPVQKSVGEKVSAPALPFNSHCNVDRPTPVRPARAVLEVQAENRICDRPDRVGRKLMSARVTLPTWRFFKKGSAELDVTQEAMLRSALALFMSRFRGVPERDYQTVWEAIRKEAAGS